MINFSSTFISVPLARPIYRNLSKFIILPNLCLFSTEIFVMTLLFMINNWEYVNFALITVCLVMKLNVKVVLLISSFNQIMSHVLAIKPQLQEFVMTLIPVPSKDVSQRSKTHHKSHVKLVPSLKTYL